MGTTFFKRGGEILALRFCDITVDYSAQLLTVVFHVEKKAKRRKICAACNCKNALRNTFCGKCGRPLDSSSIVEEGQPEAKYILQKTLKYPFCHYILEWLDAAKAQGAKASSYVFPPFRPASGGFDFTSRLTVQRLDQILQQLDKTMTSSMFRYGKIEYLLKLKNKDGSSRYSEEEIQQVTNHERRDTLMNYAKRKGLTVAQKKFAGDVE
jgi:hypothetical protein